MKIKGLTITLLSVAIILLLTMSSAVFAQEEAKVKMDEYKAQLMEWQSREAAASEKSTALQAEIDALNSQITEVQSQIDGEWEAIYAMIGTDKASVEAFKANLDEIDSKFDGLAALSPEELFRSVEEIDEIKAQLEEAKSDKIAIISCVSNRIAELEGKVASLEAKLPANIFDQYTVLDGDYLWKIAKKDEIYGNAYQWIRIYSVNRDQIKDPDLIYSDQIFNIARGVGRNEHLVAKGEYLAKIAGYAKVLNDPTKWTKLYEANKDMVSDPSLIYPYQVLTIPAE